MRPGRHRLVGCCRKGPLGSPPSWGESLGSVVQGRCSLLQLPVPGAGGQQCGAQLRAARSVHLGWDVHTRFAVCTSWCGGPGTPPASSASADKVGSDQMKMTQPCSGDAGQWLKPLADLAGKEALNGSTGLRCL